MRTWLCVCLTLFTIVGAAARQQAANVPTGVWTGTWEGGGGTGGIEFTIEAGKDGTLTGKVAVTGEPTYNADFASLTFDGSKLTASYDFPQDSTLVVKLAGSLDAAKGTGTWTAVPKAGGDEVASGTWTVAKK